MYKSRHSEVLIPVLPSQSPLTHLPYWQNSCCSALLLLLLVLQVVWNAAVTQVAWQAGGVEAVASRGGRHTQP